MGFVLFLASAFLLAFVVQDRLCRFERGAERAGATVLLGFLILVGTSWGLALAGHLDGRALWACTGALLLGGGGGLFQHLRRTGAPRLPDTIHPMTAGVLACLGLATLYIIVRGSLVPPLEFDALSYHLPKAVEIMRAGRIPHIPSGDFRIAYFPWNYEILLADGLILAHGDQQSYWIGLLATAGFGCFVYAALRRAWPRATSADAWLGLLFVVAAPVIILHAGANKNDMLFAFFLMAGIHWTTCWTQDGGAREGVLALAALALAFGTKSTVLFFLPVAGIIAWRERARWLSWRRAGARAWALGLVAAALLVALSGAAWPLLNLAWCGKPLGDMGWVGGVSGFQSNAVPNYTGFSNLWRFPLLLLLRPFSSHANGVWVFWKHQYWYWPAYNGIYSHFGWLCSVLVALVPLGVHRHLAEREEGGAYRRTLTWIILGFSALSLPQGYRVDGMFCTFPRYLMSLPLLVALWALLPGLLLLKGRGRGLPAWGLALALMATFAGQCGLAFLHDGSKPLSLVGARLQTPDYMPDLGVETALDKVAGPEDPIAFDSGYGAFVYPLYGARLSRPLVYLARGPEGVRIPPGAKWVVIDRKWNVGWSHPGARTTADFFLPIQRGASQEDLELAMRLAKDPDYVLVYNAPADDQWVFLARRFQRQPNS